eukprot:1971215-Pyramimonas_sp.AAC.1
MFVGCTRSVQGREYRRQANELSPGWPGSNIQPGGYRGAGGRGTAEYFTSCSLIVTVVRVRKFLEVVRVRPISYMSCHISRAYIPIFLSVGRSPFASQKEKTPAGKACWSSR